MQHETIQHKHKTLYTIKKSNKAVKNKRNDKRLCNNDKKYDYVPSVSNIHNDWS